MGSDWRRSWRAHWIICWVARAFRRARDRGDRGRTYWREKNHESRPRGLGHVSGRSGRRHRETIHRAHYDRDLSDERAVAVIRRAPSVRHPERKSRDPLNESFKVTPRDPSPAGAGLGMTRSEERRVG